jgi:hypothetical protein
MVYGTGTRSYNRSTEARTLKKQRAEATRREEERIRAGKFETIIVGPICTCLAFNYAHEAIAHERCLTSKEGGVLNTWLKAGNESFYWIGWAELGTTIRFRRYDA